MERRVAGAGEQARREAPALTLGANLNSETFSDMIARLLISAVAVWVTAWLLEGVTVEPWWAAIIVAVVLGLINTFIRPVVKLLALPLNIVTLGLFSLVINALMVMLCDWFTPYLQVENFLYALWFSIVLTVVNWVLHLFTGKD